MGYVSRIVRTGGRLTSTVSAAWTVSSNAVKRLVSSASALTAAMALGSGSTHVSPYSSMDTNRPEVRVSSGVRVLDEETVTAAIATTAARITLLLLILLRIRLL